MYFGARSRLCTRGHWPTGIQTVREVQMSHCIKLHYIVFYPADQVVVVAYAPGDIGQSVREVHVRYRIELCYTTFLCNVSSSAVTAS